MKKVLSAIGRFFKGIGNWIKTTAWIQPLLIVGAIFALIMSIKPISNWIGEITATESISTFYDDHKVSFKDLFGADGKMDKTTEDTNKTLIVILIREENEECANCVAAENHFEQFFNLDHEGINNRTYEIAVLDIASDELYEDEGGDPELLKDFIDQKGLSEVYENMDSEYKDPNGKVDTAADDGPISTPAILRIEDGQCVGIMMSYDNSKIETFTHFCYYDPETNFKDRY